MLPPQRQAPLRLPDSPSAGSSASHPHPRPAPTAKERATHLLLALMVTPVPRAFHAGRRTRQLFKSLDISTSLITWGVKRQSSAGCLPASARPLCCRPPVWAVATGLEGEWASRQAQVRAAWRRGRQHAGPTAPGPRVPGGSRAGSACSRTPRTIQPGGSAPEGGVDLREAGQGIICI